MAIGQGHSVCWQEPAEKMRQEEAKLWRKMIKERMGERWEVSRQTVQREEEAQPRSQDGSAVSHPPLGMQNLLRIRKPGFWSWLCF